MKTRQKKITFLLTKPCSLTPAWRKDYVWVLTKVALIVKQGRFPFWMTHDFQVSLITDIRSDQGPPKSTPSWHLLRELLSFEQLTVFKAANDPNYGFICTRWFLTRIKDVIIGCFNGFKPLILYFAINAKIAMNVFPVLVPSKRYLIQSFICCCGKK